MSDFYQIVRDKALEGDANCQYELAIMLIEGSNC